ncbi:hypothetical protein F3Y22_tig00112857pilonHSYRG00130 [Hibiscus syriacus]|uniref:Glucose-methanol-choline oxidoreductase N-terminal domain-containing protein n=1 Tax=Hibiscus syriacus TaxID=106335 RepID=A0A6A2Y5A9_HIBSY|nr:hypothetical protein F3Y22_tig00112857pilonHSYRG00130 [Hibiscus syriacus]
MYNIRLLSIGSSRIRFQLGSGCGDGLENVPAWAGVDLKNFTHHGWWAGGGFENISAKLQLCSRSDHSSWLSYHNYFVIAGGTAGCPLAATLLNNSGRRMECGSVINAGFYSHADPEFIKEARLDEALVKQSYQWVEKKVAFESPVLGTKIGATIFDRNHRRHTAADLLEYANPTNIKVYLHATVHKIITTENKLAPGSRPKAAGVIYKDATGLRHKAYLTKERNSEIIVSSGAIGSPQLLMLSGIGPASQLKANQLKAKSE